MNEKNWHWRTRIEAASRALTKRGINVVIAQTGEEACSKVLSLIPKGSSVGVGGSRTMDEIGLLDALRSGDYKLIDQYDPKLTREAAFKGRRDSLQADYFIAGSNAVTEDGKLVNIDGLGNRVAGMAFGPGKVILVVGRNKIVKDLAAAIDRVKNVAAPINAKRFGANLPCVETGVCGDCDSPDRICNLTLIIEGQRIPGRMTVVLIDQELGF